MLRKYKINADCALSGQEACDIIKKENPVYDFIFMDHLMPVIDGIEAVRMIRSLGGDYAKNIPVIALTADEAAGDERAFLDNGFQAVLYKPLSIAKLDKFIKDWIS